MVITMSGAPVWSQKISDKRAKQSLFKGKEAIKNQNPKEDRRTMKIKNKKTDFFKESTQEWNN